MVKATVVIPTYKRPNETAYCLGLIAKSKGLGQEFELEIIVIDSSPDQSARTEIEKFKNIFDLKYIHLRQKTLPGEARNMAIREAKYELIISIDSDIEVSPDTISMMISFLKENPGVARMTGTSIFSSGEKKEQIDRPTKWDRIYQYQNTDFIEGIYGRYEAFYKSVFQKLGGYDSIFGACGEGTDISVQFWRAGFPLSIDTNIIAYHNSEAPESLRRTTPDRMTSMYRSLFLVAYKYDVSEPKFSPNFISSYLERKASYGDLVEFYAIISAAKSIEWFKENYDKIIASKNAVPKEFDFKPFDIFSDSKLLKKCLEEAQKKIDPYYRKVFNS